MSVGNNIRQARKTASVTQEELGSRLNVGKSTVCEWESGKRSVPIDMLSEIALALNTSVPFLMGWDIQSFSSDAFVPLLSNFALECARKFDQLDAHGQKAIAALLDIELERCQASAASLSIEDQYRVAVERYASSSEDPSAPSTLRAAKS